MTTSNELSAYEILPNNRFFSANRSIVEYEIRPGNTVTFLHEVDLTEVERIRQAAGEQKPSYTAFVVKAVALALKDFPYANRRLWGWRWIPFFRTRLQQFHHHDIAVACERNIPDAEVSTFVDIIRDADRLSLQEITLWLRNLATCDVTNNQQWRSFSTIIRRLPHWLSTILIRLPVFFPRLWVKYRGGAALISSPAKYGVDVVSATWSSPLGGSFGGVTQRPVVREGQVVPAPTFIFTLNFDRRVMAGAQAARFCKRILDCLEGAEQEMAEFIPPAEKATAPPPECVEVEVTPP
ncbi:MAG: 2-oxo acid dehydrogenase subunit E2 [Gemmataceae bacterium]|nr:2-oxo acid dehydrogenase subunit E2 [Gemmataceae bacterium]